MKVSVVVPSYNQAPFLDKTLASIFSQEGPLEVLAQDGGSTDGSVEILKEYSEKYSPTPYPQYSFSYVSGKDGGQTAAINAGHKKSTGDILCYLNSDDIWLPGTLARVRETFDKNPNTGFVYGQADFIDREGHFLREYPVKPFSYKRLLQTCFICQPACFWRRSIYEKYGELNEKLDYTMDYEYWLRAGRSEQFLMIPCKLAQSRFHAGAKSMKDKVKVNAEALEMLEAHCKSRPALSWIRGYVRSRADETTSGFGPYIREYCRGLKEMRERYKLNWPESAWILWKLQGSYRNKGRMGY